MTDDERTQITKLKREGYSYSRIAAMVGVKENTVKTFCRRNNLTIKKTDVPVKVIPEITVQPCKCCGKPVLQTKGRKEKKFCSDECRIKWWNKHLYLVKRKAMYEYTCPTCGKQFSAYGCRSRKYCSHECYILDRYG